MNDNPETKPEDFAEWAQAGVAELIWGVPDAAEDVVIASMDKLAGKLGIGG